MTKPKLTYFDFTGSRGEECRLAFAIAGVEFEDNRIARADWPALKPSTPYGKMPLLDLEGKPQLSECNAILELIGRKYDLLPSDEWEAARHLSLLCAGEGLRNDTTRTFGIEDPEALKQARKEYAEGPLRSWGESVERQIQGPWFGGDKISVADIKIYVLVGWIKKGVLDHVPADSLDGLTKLMGVYDGVKNHPKVVAFYAN